jgi:hypothetical protein
MVLAPVLVLYAAVGWGRKEPVFAPLAAFSSVGSDSDNSSLARLEEMTNLIYTFTEFGNPLLGTGWGHPYQKISSVYANFGKEWWQYAYMPHNSLLAVVTFSGLVGIFGMLGVMPVGAFLATRGYRSATNAIERAAAMASRPRHPVDHLRAHPRHDARRRGARVGPGPRPASGRRPGAGGRAPGPADPAGGPNPALTLRTELTICVASRA